MANQTMSQFGINPNNMRLPMGVGRTFVLNQRYVPGVGFSNGFGVINSRGQSFYSGQSTSFRGGGQSAVMNYSRPGFAFGQGWVQGGGLSGSRFGFSNGRVSGGASFLYDRRTGVMSLRQDSNGSGFRFQQTSVSGGINSGSRVRFAEAGRSRSRVFRGWRR